MSRSTRRTNFPRTSPQQRLGATLATPLGLALLLASAAPAQELLHSFSGEASSDALGVTRSAGDLDGDGLHELLLGAPLHDGVGADSGMVRLVDGASGATLASWFGGSAGEYLGRAVSGVGDLDLDGVPDALVGAPGAPGSAGPGAARVFSGATGALLLDLAGSQAGGAFGYAVSGAGDLDQDGVPDLYVGAPGEAHDGLAGAGRVHVLGGADGSSLAVLGGHAAGDSFGRTVDGGWWASSEGDTQPPIGASVGAMGYIEVFDAQFGSRFVAASAGLGGALARIDDLDGDGTHDVLAGAWSQGRVLALSGEDGSVLLDVQRDPASAFGHAVSRAGDVDGDGLTDLAVGAPADDTVFVLSGADGSQLELQQSGSGDTYGWSLDAAGGTRVAVGCPLADQASPDSGRIDLVDFGR